MKKSFLKNISFMTIVAFSSSVFAGPNSGGQNPKRSFSSEASLLSAFREYSSMNSDAVIKGKLALVEKAKSLGMNSQDLHGLKLALLENIELPSVQVTADGMLIRNAGAKFEVKIEAVRGTLVDLDIEGKKISLDSQASFVENYQKLKGFDQSASKLSLFNLIVPEAHAGISSTAMLGIGLAITAGLAIWALVKAKKSGDRAKDAARRQKHGHDKLNEVKADLAQTQAELDAVNADLEAHEAESVLVSECISVSESASSED